MIQRVIKKRLEGQKMTLEELSDYNDLVTLASDDPIRSVFPMKLNIDICIPTLTGVPSLLLKKLRDETIGDIYISKVKPLTSARIELIKQVKTTFFLFLDDDIIYPEGLLLELYAYMIGGTYYFVKKYKVSFKSLPVGAVQGSVSSIGLGDKWDKALRTNSLKVPKYTSDRLYCSNMLIKTSLVKDWKPDPNLSGCEDWDLTRHIRHKGHSCITVPSKVLHKRSWLKTKKNALWFGRSYPNLFKHFPLVYLLKLGGVFGKNLIRFPFNFRRSFYTMYQNFYIIKGMISNYFEDKG